MANEAPKIDWGWGISGTDMRNSTLSGTTRGGPNGSGQFLAVQLSTTVDLTANLCTVSGMPIMGICQNKPSTGIAIDVTIFGMTKAVAASTAIAAGQELQNSSTQPGAMIPFSSAAGAYAAGRSLTAATAIGQVFSMFLYGGGGRLG